MGTCLLMICKTYLHELTLCPKTADERQIGGPGRDPPSAVYLPFWVPFLLTLGCFRCPWSDAWLNLVIPWPLGSLAAGYPIETPVSKPAING